MAADLKKSNACANAEVNALSARLANGFCRVYDATGGVPATADTALTTQKLLIEWRWNAVAAFDAAAAGAAVAKAVATVPGTQSGVAAFFRAVDVDGTTTEFQDSVGGSGSGEGIELSNVNIEAGGNAVFTGYTYTQDKT